jgi:hypothetical protein
MFKEDFRKDPLFRVAMYALLAEFKRLDQLSVSRECVFEALLYHAALAGKHAFNFSEIEMESHMRHAYSIAASVSVPKQD